jgi:hypothetical protein
MLYSVTSSEERRCCEPFNEIGVGTRNLPGKNGARRLQLENKLVEGIPLVR